MLTYLGSDSVKAQIVQRMKAHVAADQLVQGMGFNDRDNKGCFVGCTRDRFDHYDDSKDGLPAWLMLLCDSIHEGLPKEDTAQNAVAILEAIPVGKDLTHVRHELMAWILGPDSPSAKGNAHPLVAEAVAAVRGLHQRSARADGQVTQQEWSAAASAASAAWSAASSVAWSAASAASAESAESAESAASAAWSAAESAASAAWSAASAESAAESAASAAWSAAESAASAAWSAAESAASAAWSAAWKTIANKLIELLKAA